MDKQAKIQVNAIWHGAKIMKRYFMRIQTSVRDCVGRTLKSKSIQGR